MTVHTEKTIYDDYEITDIIGEGTFSTVTLAYHKNTLEKYAVKIIDKEFLNSHRREMVDWEISILSKCDHPSIVEFIECYESEQDICLVLEWVPSGDLFDRIIKGGVFSEDVARATMKSILLAVEYLHDRSIVHRDIKPENILFQGEDGDVKLADFGLSKYYEEAVGMDTACGTPVYSAPEINNNQVYRKGVDIWSCGCILYFILFGRPPFYSDDESTVYRLVSQGTWEFPPNTTVSDDVKDYIGKLLEQDPSKRLTAKQALSHKWMGDSNYYNNNHNYNSTRIIEIEPSSSVLLPTSNPVSSSSSSQQCGLSSSSSSSSLSSLSSSMAPDLHIIESFLTPQKPEFIPTSIRSSLQRSFEQHMQQQQQIMQQQTNNINNSNNYNQPESIPHMRLSSQSNSTLSLSSSSSSIRNSNSTSSSNLLKSPIRNSSNQTTIPLSPQKSSQPISIQNSHLRNSLNSSVDAFRTNNSPTMFNNPNV